MIGRYARPQLRGTPITPEDVYSEILYDIGRGSSWLLRIWEENNGSFDNAEAAIVRAVQYAVKSLLGKWNNEVRRFAAEDDQQAQPDGISSVFGPEDWIRQFGERQRIMDAVEHAGLTEAEACLVLAQLADRGQEDVDRLIAEALRRGDPASMDDDERKRLTDYRRQIQRRAYAKLRVYLEREDGKGGSSDE
jgi:hypothetical protein